MALSTKHTKVATLPDDPLYEVGTSEWNDDHTLLVADKSFVGKSTAGAGAVAELSIATAKTMLAYTPADIGAAPALGVDDNYVTDAEKIILSNTSGTNTGDNAANTSSVAHSLATAANDFIVASGVGVFIKKTLAEAKTILGLTGTNSGDQTSIVGISGTIAQFNTACTDADFATLAGNETLSNKTLSGDLILAENAAILLDPALSLDGKYNGITRAGTAGATLVFGDLCHLSPVDSRWELADANSAAGALGDARGILGICILAAAGDGSATTMLLHGIVRADAVFPALTVNGPVYVSETAGDVTMTQPVTTDAVIKVIGFGLTADELFFNPDNIYITHT